MRPARAAAPMPSRAAASRRTILTICVLLAACGPKPAPTWIEHEGRGTDASHASAPVHGPVAAAPIDASKIDSYDEATLRAALDRLGDQPPAGAIALRLARLAHHRGDEADARALLARAAAAGQATGDLAIPAPTVDAKTIAVLLPLSGPYAAIGTELRAAIELAPASGTKWLVLDTKGTPDGAAAAVATADQRGAVGILGPVGTREAIAAARAAVLHGLPIVLLAPADGADPRSGVFRAVDSPADEARAVARFAAQDNVRTVAVLAPRDDLGEEAADAFADEAAHLGLRLTARGSYDPTGGDVEPDIKRFLHLVPAENPELAEHLARVGPKKGWTTFQPDISFSLLYIPDRYDRAAIVAAFLPYYNVELRTTDNPDLARLAKKHGGHIPTVVQLVGGAGWHHSTLPIRGGAAVQGAMIFDAFAGEQGGDIAAQLIGAFQQKLGRPPGTAAAEAYDAATLVGNARAAVASSPDPRMALRGALARGRLDDGACGPAVMAEDGELARTPVVLEVVGEELQLVP